MSDSSNTNGDPNGIPPQPGSSASSASSAPAGGPVQQDLPEYGQMSNKCPGWDPYVYGKPETEKSGAEQGRQGDTGAQPSTQQQDTRRAANTSGNGGGPAGSSNQPSGNFGFQQPFFYNRQGQQIPLSEFKPDDPDKNPLYGRWSAMAIWSLVLSIFMLQPFALFLAGLAIPRARMFHMRGRVLAVIALILSAAEIAFIVWWIMTGHTVEELSAILNNFIDYLQSRG